MASLQAILSMQSSGDGDTPLAVTGMELNKAALTICTGGGGLVQEALVSDGLMQREVRALVLGGGGAPTLVQSPPNKSRCHVTDGSLSLSKEVSAKGVDEICDTLSWPAASNNSRDNTCLLPPASGELSDLDIA
jgi:hypothetical protein